MSIDTLIDKLPKAELHVHIEGTLEPELVFELAERNDVALEYPSVAHLRAAYVFSNLQEFLDIYYTGMNVLQTAQDFRDLAVAYFDRAQRDNVRHVEMFFDPQAHTERGVPISAVMDGFREAIDSTELSVLIIPCFLRHLPPAKAQETLDELTPYIEEFAGVGLDSSELNHPPVDFAPVYDRAHELGLRRVAHAGEEGPPDYVWQALDALDVDRIDHGNRAMEDDRLVAHLADEGVPLTVCPLSNLKLAVVSDLREHPLKSMLQAGLIATVNSDDPAYFGGYINENFRQIAAALSLDQNDVVTLAKNSFAASFLPNSEISRWISEIDTAAAALTSSS